MTRQAHKKALEAYPDNSFVGFTSETMKKAHRDGFAWGFDVGRRETITKACDWMRCLGSVHDMDIEEVIQLFKKFMETDEN